MSDPPAAQRRRLQIKLGRPKPPPTPTPTASSTTANGRANGSAGHTSRGIRISLKRRPSRTARQDDAGSGGQEHDDADDDEEDESDSDGDRDSIHGEGGIEEEQDDEEDSVSDDDDKDERQSHVGRMSRNGWHTNRDSDEDQDEDIDEDDNDGENEAGREYGEEMDEDKDEDQEQDDEGNEDEDADEDAGQGGFAFGSGTRTVSGSSSRRGAGGSSWRDRPTHLATSGDDQATASRSTGLRSRPIKRLRTKGLYDALPKLIENLKRRDSYKFFWEPVDLEEVPNYRDFISHPMDLGTMEKKVQERTYCHMDEFKRDFQLVVENAQTFNPAGTLFHGEGKKLQQWGNRAIEREGMAVNDNGRAGVKGDMLRRKREAARLVSGDGQALDTPTQSRPRKMLRMSTGGNAGLDALIDAARLKPGDEERAVAALALANATRSGRAFVDGAIGYVNDMDVEVKREGGDGDLSPDENMDDAEAEEEEANASERRSVSFCERSVTTDVSGPSIYGRRLSSARLSAMSPATPISGALLRHASPDSLRKRLATVTSTPLAAFVSSSSGGGGGSMARPTPVGKVKPKHRLGPPGTPKRLAAALIASSSGAATPASAKATQAAAAAAAAAAVAAAASTSAQAAPTNLPYALDGSISPDDVEDLYSFLALRCSTRPVLIPTIESLHPLPFVPQKHADRDSAAAASSLGAKKKEKERDNDDRGSGDKDGDKEKEEKDKDKDKSDKPDKTEKADKDPLATLPPGRPGVPDSLFTAIAPAPERCSANYSHDIDVLPADLATLPFHIPSASSSTAVEGTPSLLPIHYENIAYTQALQNEARPKKNKDREREKEKEYCEDWTQFRPHLSRLLEARDLGLWSTLPGPSATGVVADTELGQVIKVEGERDFKRHLEAFLDGAAGAAEPQLADVVMASAAGGAGPAAVDAMVSWSRGVLRDTVWKGGLGEAYARSLAEFISGAVDSPFVWEEGDELPVSMASDADATNDVQAKTEADASETQSDEREVEQQSAASLSPAGDAAAPLAPPSTVSGALPAEALLPLPLADYVATKVLDPLSGGMLSVLQLAHQHLSSIRSLSPPSASALAPAPAPFDPSSQSTTAAVAPSALESHAEGLDADSAAELNSKIEQVLST